MKKSELKNLIKEIIKEQSLNDPRVSNEKLQAKLTQLKTAIDRKLLQLGEQRFPKDPKPSGTSREEYENPLFRLIDKILCWLEGNDWGDC
jgi:hypothetical protein